MKQSRAHARRPQHCSRQLLFSPRRYCTARCVAAIRSTKHLRGAALDPLERGFPPFSPCKLSICVYRGVSYTPQVFPMCPRVRLVLLPAPGFSSGPPARTEPRRRHSPCRSPGYECERPCRPRHGARLLVVLAVASNVNSHQDGSKTGDEGTRGGSNSVTQISRLQVNNAVA